MLDSTAQKAGFIGACAILALIAQPALGYRGRGGSYNRGAAMNAQKQQMIQAAQQQLAAAKQVLAAAQSDESSAKTKLDSALSKLKESSQQFHEAQSTARHLAKQ